MRPLAGKGVLRMQAGRVADADIALWDPTREVTIRNDDLHRRHHR